MFLPALVRFPSLFFFNDTAPTEIYTLSLHDALPILSSNFVGDIDEVRVFSRALTVEEIAALAPAPPPPADGLVLSYDMEIGSAHVRTPVTTLHRKHASVRNTTDVAGKIGRARHFNTG